MSLSTSASTSGIAVAGRRPASITWAAALLLVMALLGVLAAVLGESENGMSFVAIALTISAVRAVSAVGVWRLRRWAAILGFVVTLLDTLLAIPGIFVADSTWFHLLAAIAVVLGVTNLILLVWPSARRAYA